MLAFGSILLLEDYFRSSEAGIPQRLCLCPEHCQDLCTNLSSRVIELLLNILMFRAFFHIREMGRIRQAMMIVRFLSDSPVWQLP